MTKAEIMSEGKHPPRFEKKRNMSGTPYPPPRPSQPARAGSNCGPSAQAAAHLAARTREAQSDARREPSNAPDLACLVNC